MAASTNHHRLYRVLAAILVLGYGAAVRAVEFAGGTGEPNDPYQIATAEQLVGMGQDPNLYASHFVLVDDLDLDPNLPGGQVFLRSLIAPYGPRPRTLRDESPKPIYGSFEGVFDGDGHIIRNMVIRVEDEAMTGLFGHVSATGRIEDLGIEGLTIQRSSDGDLAFAAGGLVAVNEGGTILRCYASGSIAGPERIRLPGEVRTLAANDDVIGGLVGANTGLINTCYALVDVSGTGAIGGLIGDNSQGLVYFSFSAGKVRGTGWPGGLVGRSETSVFSRAGRTILDDPGTAIRCFWDTQAGGILDSAAGEGRTTAEMMHHQTYTPWTYTGVWVLRDGHGYPQLLWEHAPIVPSRKTGPGPRLIGPQCFGYAGGSGDPNDPYRIERAEQFLAIGCHPEDFDKSFVLKADLDFGRMDHSQALPIGFDRVSFNGRFDGGSHSLSNLTISQPRAKGVGVFGLVGDASVALRDDEVRYEIRDDGSYSLGFSGGTQPVPESKSTIRDLYVHNVTVVGRQQVGGLIGLGLGAVTDCSVTGQVTGLAMVGGLVGRSLGGDLSGCHADIRVNGEFAVGGLVGMTGPELNLFGSEVDGLVAGELFTGGLIGYSLRDTINRCAARVDVYGRYNAGGCLGYASASTVAKSCSTGAVLGERQVGGFVGEAGAATIGDCYCRTDVTGGDLAGGFAGHMASKGRIARCYAGSSITATGSTSPVPSVGAFVGYVSKTASGCAGDCPIDIVACFWDADISPIADGLGNRPSDPSNAAGLPTARLRTAEPFITAGWDFADTWTICEGLDYPRLRWEAVRCEEGF